MKNIKKLVLIALLITFIFSLKAFSADNIGRNVYSVYSENFNGVKIEFPLWRGQSDRPETPDINSFDRAAFWPNRWSNGSISVSELLYGESEERVDGNKYWRASIVLNDPGSVWMPVLFVSGSNSEIERNMTAYNGGTLEFWIRSTSFGAENVRVGIKAEWGNKVMSLRTHFIPNGKWQKIVIPLSSLYSLNRVSSPFILLAESNQFSLFPRNLVIDIDNIVWKKAGGAGSFSVNIKNSSDNAPASEITWNANALGQRWQAASQYIELNLDNLSDDRWGIQIYTANTESSASPKYTGTLTSDMASGLVADSDTTKMLPMCWRVSDKVLPYTGSGVDDDFNKTLIIDANSGGIYDVGTDDPGKRNYYTWFAMKDRAMFGQGDPDVKSGADYLRVWDRRGFHSAAGAVNYWGMSPGSMYQFMIMPRIYFGADFSNAVTPMVYQTNSIIIELFYE